MSSNNFTATKDPLSRNPAAKLAAKTARDELLEMLMRSGFLVEESPPAATPGSLNPLQQLLSYVDRLLNAIADAGRTSDPNSLTLEGRVIRRVRGLIEAGFVEFLMRVALQFLGWNDLYAKSGTMLVSPP